MDRDQQAKEAVLNLLRAKQLALFQPLSMYEIGKPLVPIGFSDHELADAVLALADDGVVQILRDNALQLIAPI